MSRLSRCTASSTLVAALGSVITLGASSRPLRTVVLLPAGICDRRSWDPQWAALSEGHRVLRVDMPGFGQSPLEESRF